MFPSHLNLTIVKKGGRGGLRGAQLGFYEVKQSLKKHLSSPGPLNGRHNGEKGETKEVGQGDGGKRMPDMDSPCFTPGPEEDMVKYVLQNLAGAQNNGINLTNLFYMALTYLIWRQGWGQEEQKRRWGRGDRR
ncbi:MAG TPA: hypothetical protein ENN54_01940 [Thermoplasmatales archaeon]|nr:hypothetical protein [Thermoplasmatales archaeon]